MQTFRTCCHHDAASSTNQCGELSSFYQRPLHRRTVPLPNRRADMFGPATAPSSTLFAPEQAWRSLPTSSRNGNPKCETSSHRKHAIISITTICSTYLCCRAINTRALVPYPHKSLPWDTTQRHVSEAAVLGQCALVKMSVVLPLIKSGILMMTLIAGKYLVGAFDCSGLLARGRDSRQCCYVTRCRNLGIFATRQNTHSRILPMIY